MRKLMKLEWKKNNIGKYIRIAVILTALLCLFTFALAFLGIADDPDGTLDAAPGMDTISSPIELFTGMAFLIFASVMLASFIVSAYKNKTMNLMFTYPVKRQKILASQMMAVKSSKAAIITSFLLIFLTQANVGDFTMADNAVFPLVLTAVSFGFAVLSICNVENKDVL
ncbi:hypothetical protein C805_02627 [Eubacterium sp. 14-2]|uniref:ABC transporter permease n=1 Tax=Eubacterium sp. 14-2 TaxID=1235790 RepID=UPI00034151CD|nr:ABC transporter permease [Eubacterium sp. 14-2]EOT24415.1 hypothetical protein C805_02627 [Eubacterium sp. 14-2]